MTTTKENAPDKKSVDAEQVHPKRKKLNATQRNDLDAAAVQHFVKKYGRKAQKGQEPNDRQYSRTLEEKISKMKPEKLSALMNGDDEEGAE